MLEASDGIYDGESSHLSGRTEDERIKKALHYIEENFSTHFSTAALAKTSGLSVRNLNRLFLKDMGLSPKQVLTFYRIDRAKKY